MVVLFLTFQFFLYCILVVSLLQAAFTVLRYVSSILFRQGLNHEGMLDFARGFSVY